MLLSTPGLVLHTTPYAETSVVVKVFTRLLGVRAYIIKGVRGRGGLVKQNMLQPLTSLDMVVYDNPHSTLNYVKELTPRHPHLQPDPVAGALRFFMTEVLYKALHDEEPMPDLWDFAEQAASGQWAAASGQQPVLFMLAVARHLGIEPLDNHMPHEPYFDLDQGRFVAVPTETTLAPALSLLLHQYLAAADMPQPPLQERTALLNALIAYYQLHLSGFNNFTSHEILHTILR